MGAQHILRAPKAHVAAASTPDAIFGANLKQWQKPETLGADTTAISSWTDTSGNSNPVTQGTGSKQPVVAAGVLNGLKVARFDGTDDQLLHTYASALAQPCEVFIVCKKRTAADGTIRPFYTSFSPANKATVTNTALTLQTDSGSLFTGDAGTIAALSGGFHAWHFVSNGASSAIRLDNVSAVTGDTGAIGLDSFTVGTDWSGLPNDIDIAEMVVIDRTSTSGERTSMQSYFHSHFGI